MIRLFALIAAIALTFADTSAQELFRVYFFDVGQGDAVLIQSTSGPSVLYDAGESPSRILAHLETVKVSRLDLVIASHNHTDHIGGFTEVVRRFRPRFYLDNGIPATTLTYQRVLAAVQAAGTRLLEPTSRRIRLGDDAFIDVVPPSGNPSWNQNDNVVGLILSIGTFRLSLAGDAERRQWNWWLLHHRDLLRPVDIHKASHHGSTNGDTAAALSVLSPESVIVSVGSNNGYGHPRPEVLRLYGDHGSTVFRTDLNGTIVVEVNESGRYTIRLERGEGAKPPAVVATVPKTEPR